VRPQLKQFNLKASELDKGASIGHLLHRCWFPCKASLSAGGRWASSSLTFLRGLTYSAFPAGVFALPSNQPLEAPTHINETWVHHNNKKSERVWFSIKNLHSSFRFFF